MSAKSWHGLALLTTLAIASSALAQAPQTEYAPSTYPEAYADNTFYPGMELRALPAASAQRIAARAELRRAESDLNNSIEDVRRGFHRSAELHEALSNEREAYDALVAARENAIADVKQDSAYRAMRSLRQRLAKQIELRSADAPQDSLIAMATLKLSYAVGVTAMEVGAIASDPRVNDAREHLLATGKRVAELNEQFDDAVRNSAVVLAARKTLEDARVAALASDAFYLEARNVANVSIDYAYFLRRHPYPYVVNSPFYSSGYPQFGYPIGWQTSMVAGSALPRRH